MSLKRKKGESKQESKSDAELVHDLLGKDKKRTYQSQVLFDPNQPIVSATDWIQMPHPWNKLTGTKGIPFGHVTTIQGKPDSGKTTLAMHGMVEAQEQGFNVVLIDTEFKFNFDRLEKMGGVVKKMNVLKADSIEDGFVAMSDIIDAYIKINGRPTLVVWDSLGLTPTDDELKAGLKKASVALAARIIKRSLRILRAKFHKTNTGVVFINHLYDNINALFGNSTKGYGGNGAYFASSLVLEVQRIQNKYKQVKGERVVSGVVSGIKCTKNHLSNVQGAKCQVLIGETGIDQGSIEELKAKGTANEDDIDVDIDDIDVDIPDGPKIKMKNGREVTL